MRMRVRIDDDIHAKLHQRAANEGQSLTQYVNRVLRIGLALLRDDKRSRSRRFRQRSYSMGAPVVEIKKVLSLAALLEDEVILSRLRPESPLRESEE